MGSSTLEWNRGWCKMVAGTNHYGVLSVAIFNMTNCYIVTKN